MFADMISQIVANEKTAKRDLRALMLERRRSFSREELLDAGRRAAARLVESPLWRAARSVALYRSLPDEFPTDPLARAAWLEDKTVLFPKIVDQKARKMIFYLCRGENDLVPGPFGISEPAGDEERAPDLVILPGLAFDRRGARLGYGGGYYDRWLGSLAERPPLVGLCHDFQILTRVPTDALDIPVNYLLTPSGLLCL